MRNSHFVSLNPKDELFKKLKGENPDWWQFVKDNIQPDGFYVDIRKNNTLNVYYNGGSLLRIRLSRGVIKGEIHEKYLGRGGSKYVDYNLDCLPKEAEVIKERIASHFNADSENGIKARLINAPNANYIDSEFAYPEFIGTTINGVAKYKTTRIDLTKLENGKIIFVELKRIKDGRLLNNEYENGSPEILAQMQAYHQFITLHKQEITDYYKTLFIIKHQLGILPLSLKHIDNINDYSLSENVELYIDSTPYTKITSKRKKRFNAIKSILDKHNIIHNL